MKGFLFFAVVALCVSCATDTVSITSKSECPTRFNAVIESEGSRTQLDDALLTCWTEGDCLTIYTGETYNREFQFDGKTGDISGGFDLISIDKAYYSAYDVDANYAIYPHQDSNQLIPYDLEDASKGAYFLATFPAEQPYFEDSFAPGIFPMVAVTTDKTDGRLYFKNVGGCVFLSFYGVDQIVKSVTLKGNNGEKIAGEAKIEHSNGSLPVVTMQSTATDSISVVSTGGVVVGASSEEATSFWLTLPPTTFEEGFTIVVEGYHGGTYSVATTRKQVVGRNTFLIMPALELDIPPLGTATCIEEWGKEDLNDVVVS